MSAPIRSAALRAALAGFAVVPLAACVGEPSALVTPPLSFKGQIVFTSDRDGMPNLWLIAPDGSALGRLTEGPRARIGPRISPDGTRIVYSGEGDGPPGLYVLTTRVIDDHFISLENGLQPAWSPDGQNLAFVSSPERWPQIYRARADGTDAIQLTNGADSDSHPEWSPGGGQIAFVRSSTTEFLHELYLMNGDGTGVTRLPTTETVWPARLAWSHDGRELLFMNQEFQICRLDLATLAAVRLTAGPSQNSNGTWSPDGRQIVFTRDAALYRMNADGSGLTRLTTPPLTRHDEEADWSPRE